MADPRFFTRAGPFSLRQLADIAQADLASDHDADIVIEDVAPLDQAGSGDVSFLDNKKYVDAFRSSRARACIVEAAMVDKAPSGMTLLISPAPYRSYALVAQAFYPSLACQAGHHSTALIDPSAVIGEGSQIDAHAVIGAHVRIGKNCKIAANTVIGDGVEIGDQCVIGANATISHSVIGHQVVIYPGCRIGQDGFGFAMGAAGHLKVPQLGRVIIGNDVEIGANTTIDRGAGPDTVIGDGSRIDNLVQIGHNVRLGRGCVVVAQVGISGSTWIDDYVVIAGQAGITGHLRIGAGAKIAAQAGVMRDVGAGQTVGGSPAVPMAEWLRQSAVLAKLAKKKPS